VLGTVIVDGTGISPPDPMTIALGSLMQVIEDELALRHVVYDPYGV
jgi:hypothetical protein